MSNYKGIDISNNNSSIDFEAVAADGVTHVYVKATEGASFKDSTMGGFYNGAKANGTKLGAYHFLVSTSEPEAQAENFYSMIKDYSWDLVPMLDVETTEGFSASILCDYVVRFKAAFEALSPLKLGLYSYSSFIAHLQGAISTIKDMPFWEANYDNNPWSLADNFFTNRVGHQYTETGSISGVSEGCDVDVFNDGVLLEASTIPGKWKEGTGTDAGKWWYEHEDGSYTKSGWEHINDVWYLFDGSGWMLYDWKKDGDNWYFLGGSNDGAMKYGWVKTDNKWYYFGTKDDGAMKTGWQKIDDKWYYFGSNGAMCTGWIKDDGKDYCMYSNGPMIANAVMYGYSFDASGVATKIN